MKKIEKPQSTDQIFIGRQPIFDDTLNIFGHELLFRDSNENCAKVVDQDEATSNVILNAFIEIGLDKLVGPNKAFVNLTKKFIVEESTLDLFKNRVVLEILENIKIDAEVVKSIKQLSKNGFIIALDDVVQLDYLGPLLEIVNIIKLDIRELAPRKLENVVKILKQYKLDLLAEKVETQEEYEFCKRLGFKYFQGYFLCKPTIIEGRNIPSSKLAVIQLLSKLHKPTVEINELEVIIKQDISLSYKLLQLINSVYYGMPGREVESIGQALRLLGAKEIRSWVTMLLMSKIKDKPISLMNIALIRAKMAEKIAIFKEEPDTDSFFLVGLFSVLDAILDMPLEKCLETLPISERISNALLFNEGSIGAVLFTVVAYEKGLWDEVLNIGITADIIRNAYFDAVEWSNEVCSLMQSREPVAVE